MLERTVKDVSTVKIASPKRGHNRTLQIAPFPPLDPLPASVVDSGKVRIGYYTPPFPAPSAK
jgi:hypothetical protein